MMLGPVIKWSGSKRKVARELASLAPPHNAYFEPFVGGGALIPHIRATRGFISDILPELMDLWRMIQAKPGELSEGYARHWQSLQESGHTYFYLVREEFNATRDPIALMFLSRTCVNGLIRFNKSGDFNNSLHHTRPGISPKTLENLIHEWSALVQGFEIQACDYREALAQARSGDFAFLDPPYVGTKGRYKPATFDYVAFCVELERLTRLGVAWMLTLDGTAGTRDYTSSVPDIPAQRTVYVGTGHSPFTRLMRTSLDDVLEAVHLNFDSVT
jgi:DNA adenine methylase